MKKTLIFGILTTIMLMSMMTTIVSAEASGKFTGTITVPSKVTVGERFVVKGQYTATSSGPFVIETNVDVKSRQNLAITIKSSASACDGSAFYSGKKVIGVAGQVYNFELTVKAPSTPGRYQLNTYTWTDCWKDGGKEIVTVTREIEVTQSTTCNALGAVDAIVNLPINKYNPFASIVKSGVSKVSDYGCTYEAIMRYCGDDDADGDGIGKECDYCPQVKGVPQDSNGCHPCFGLNLNDAATKQCYKQNFAEYGYGDMPAQYQNIVNPSIATGSRCDSNTAVTYILREFGNTEDILTEPCGTGTCERVNSRYVCVPKVPATQVTVTDSLSWCDGNKAVLTKIMSDGTETNEPIETCGTGFVCQEGECEAKQAPEGTERTVTIDNPECTKDSDCTGVAETCFTGQCIEAINIGWCNTNNDCDAGKECLTGFCVDEGNYVPECTSNADCGAYFECYEDFCVEALVEDDDLIIPTCTEDEITTCSDGGTVTAGKCFNGELRSTGVSCAGSSGEGAGIDTSIYIPGITDPNNPDDMTGTYVIAGIVGLGALGYLYYNQVMNKGKGKKRGKRK